MASTDFDPVVMKMTFWRRSASSDAERKVGGYTEIGKSANFLAHRRTSGYLQGVSVLSPVIPKDVSAHKASGQEEEFLVELLSTDLELLHLRFRQSLG